MGAATLDRMPFGASCPRHRLDSDTSGCSVRRCARRLPWPKTARRQHHPHRAYKYRIYMKPSSDAFIKVWIILEVDALQKVPINAE